ncbi:MAG: SRPBCC family protein [Nitrosomonadales bacterium]|nr:SRPBCC family protein [Nitrosomonadales bacterium]
MSPAAHRTIPAHTLSISISAPAEQVYAFVSNPKNLPLWASAFVKSIRFDAGAWVLQTAAGSATIEFAANNPFGILDHTVTLDSGIRVYVPMRVLRNGSGSEVLFTLFQQPSMSAAEFSADMKWVEQDLRSLKTVMETRHQESEHTGQK